MEWVIKSRREDLHSRVKHGCHEILRSLLICGKKILMENIIM